MRADRSVPQPLEASQSINASLTVRGFRVPVGRYAEPGHLSSTSPCSGSDPLRDRPAAQSSPDSDRCAVIPRFDEAKSGAPVKIRVLAAGTLHGDPLVSVHRASRFNEDHHRQAIHLKVSPQEPHQRWAGVRPPKDLSADQSVHRSGIGSRKVVRDLVPNIEAAIVSTTEPSTRPPRLRLSA